MPQPPVTSRAHAVTEVEVVQEVLPAPGVQALPGQAQVVVPAAQVCSVEGQAARAWTLRQPPPMSTQVPR